LIKNEGGVIEESAVLERNKMDVNPNQITKEFVGVVLFYAPFCGHCRRFKPEFEMVPPLIKKCGAKALMVNLEVYSNPPRWMTDGDILTVPRIVFLNKGKASVFTGERNINDIATKVCNFVGPNLQGGATVDKLRLWRQAILTALGTFRVPRKGTQDYDVTKREYEKLLRAL
jgi:hypothetical protein